MGTININTYGTFRIPRNVYLNLGVYNPHFKTNNPNWATLP
jgi:hypothetical protein